MKQKYQISFSGGRTSAYMTKLLLDNWSVRYDFIVTFANTGLEHPKTLDFVHNCDVNFGFNTVWLEAVVHDGRVASTHKIVDYATAARKGEPFEAVIQKYGIPNTAFPYCTRELKINPMNSYLRSLGLDYRTIPTAIGIREDEKRRVSKTADATQIHYPLIEVWPTDKGEILDWWAEQSFDLGIDEFEGNCQGCYKKSSKKHFMQIDRDASVYDFHRRMEQQYRSHGPQVGDRVFFRQNMDTNALFDLYNASKDAPARSARADEDSGCSESCEVYETVINDTVA
jgi:hypothetical protein